MGDFPYYAHNSVHHSNRNLTTYHDSNHNNVKQIISKAFDW